MKDKCRKCGEPFVKFPLKDENGKWIIKNFFKMDLISIVFLIAIILMTVSYVHDMKECKVIMERPCTFAMESNCCKLAYKDGNFYDPNAEEFNASAPVSYIRFANSS